MKLSCQQREAPACFDLCKKQQPMPECILCFILLRDKYGNAFRLECKEFIFPDNAIKPYPKKVSEVDVRNILYR